MALDFLERDDVGSLDLAGDAREVVPVVLAEPVLNVIGDQFHPAARRAVASPGQAAIRLVENPSDTPVRPWRVERRSMR